MNNTDSALFADTVLEQKTMIPEIYGSVDFGQLPSATSRTLIFNRSAHLDTAAIASASLITQTLLSASEITQ